MPLEPEDQRRLSAAEGYTALGMYLDADSELEQIAPDVRHRPEVLAVRLEVYRGRQQWELMRSLARKLCADDPGKVQWVVSLAWATRRADSITAARSILLEAVERHPEEAILHYNLACYECQLGELPNAKARLLHTLKLEPAFRVLALEDADLEPLWASLRK